MRGVFTLAVAIGFAGCVEKFDHDPGAAGAKAEEFARVAFVSRDSEKGYALLAAATKRYVSVAQFTQVLVRLHPKNSPLKVAAVEYEPMKGEKALYVFLRGESSAESFYYRVTMEGTAATGYRVLKFDRASEPYLPSDDRKPLGARKP